MMKRKTNRSLAILLSAGALWSLGQVETALGADESPDTSAWACRLCAISSGWFGAGEFGVLYADDPSPKFADYRGLDDDGFYLDANLVLGYRTADGYYTDIRGRNLGTDNRSLEMRGGRQGTWEWRADYRNTPRYQGHGTQTPYLGVNGDTLTLPTDWQYGRTDLLTTTRLKSERTTSAVGLTWKMGSDWSVDADFERQSKDGTTLFSSGVFATGAVLLPAPVDHMTDTFRIALGFTGERGQARAEYLSSDFDNRFASITYDSPLATGFGDERARNALEPDNNYDLFSVTGAFRVNERIRLSGKAAFGKLEQDDPLLPYSINPAFDGLALPRDSLNGKLDTTLYNVSGRAFLRLAQGLDLTAQYKAEERDNRTPTDIYTPVLLEVFPGKPRSNRPYGYDRKTGRLALRYRARGGLRFNTGFKRDRLERTYQAVLETEEDSYWGEAQFSPVAWLDARLKLEKLDRDASPYDTVGNYDRAEHPLMRKFNLAERERDRATVELDLYPLDGLVVSVSYYDTEDDYDDSLIGLTGSDISSVNFDLSYTVNPDTTVYAFLTDDDIDSTMAGADAPDADAWNGVTGDDVQTWGIGVSGHFSDRLSYGLDYISSEADGDIRVDTGAGNPAFPVLKTEMKNLRAYLRYRINDHWGLMLDLARETFGSRDWTVDGVGPYDIPSVLTMGQTSPDYETNVVRLLATFRL